MYIKNVLKNRIWKHICLIVMVAILLQSCTEELERISANQKTNNQKPVSVDETESVNQNQKTQTDNPLLSTYSEGPNDGYSWRIRDIEYDKSYNAISQEMLVSTIWVMGVHEGNNSKLAFYLDNVFRAGSNQAGVYVEGIYEILDDSNVKLTIIDSYDDEYTIKYLSKTDSVHFQFKKDKSSFRYQGTLKDKDEKVTWYRT